jgi:hypothetical protein
MPGLSRPKDGVLSHAYVPAAWALLHNLAAIYFSNSQAQTIVRHHPYCLARAPGRPVFPLSPLKDEGDGAPGGATIVRCMPASPLGNTGRLPARHPDKLAHVRIYLRASSLRRRAALFVAARETREGLRQPSSWRAARIGRQAEPRRRPGACLAGHARGRRIRSHPHDAS